MNIVYGMQIPANKNISPCKPIRLLTANIDLSTMNEHVPKTVLHIEAPSSRKFSGNISAVTTKESVETAKDCIRTTKLKLAIEIQLNDVTS